MVTAMLFLVFAIIEAHRPSHLNPIAAELIFAPCEAVGGGLNLLVGAKIVERKAGRLMDKDAW